jgi:hypothetical protein
VTAYSTKAKISDKISKAALRALSPKPKRTSKLEANYRRSKTAKKGSLVELCATYEKRRDWSRKRENAQRSRRSNVSAKGVGAQLPREKTVQAVLDSVDLLLQWRIDLFHDNPTHS